MVVEKDVHTEHCCERHGCKYGYGFIGKVCPVESGQKPQSYPCEDCGDEDDDMEQALDRAEASIGHYTYCVTGSTSTNPPPFPQLIQTEWQRRFMLNILKKHLQLRKSHFFECKNGLKREKINDEMVVIQGWLEELKENSDGVHE